MIQDRIIKTTNRDYIMLNINNVVLAGQIGSDINLLKTENGKDYCRFNVGTKDYAINESGEKHTVTDWHRCVVIGEAAINLKETCKKGTHIYLVGKNKPRFFEDNGTTKEVSELLVAAFQVIDGGIADKVDMDILLRGDAIEDSSTTVDEVSF